MLIAQICVNVKAVSIDKTFTYAVPEELNFLCAGWRVIVPFGSRKVDGFVMNVEELPGAEKLFDFELKEVIGVFDEEPWFTPEMMRAAQWISDFYLCPLSQSMSLFMPGLKGRKISKTFERIIKLAENFSEEDLKKISPRAKAQLNLMKILLEEKEISATKIC